MNVEAKRREREVGCGPHCLELSYTEISGGRLKTVLGCSACGRTEEYSVALKICDKASEKIDKAN